MIDHGVEDRNEARLDQVPDIEARDGEGNEAQPPPEQAREEGQDQEVSQDREPHDLLRVPVDPALAGVVDDGELMLDAQIGRHELELEILERDRDLGIEVVEAALGRRRAGGEEALELEPRRHGAEPEHDHAREDEARGEIPALAAIHDQLEGQEEERDHRRVLFGQGG